MKFLFFSSAALFFISLISCTQKATNNMQISTNPELKAVVAKYIQAGDDQNVNQLSQVLHPEFRVTINQFMGGDGVTVISKDGYIGMVRDKKIGGTPRQLEVRNVTVLGHTATAQVHMESKELIFDNFLTLVQDKSGNWQLLNDAATAKPHQK